MLETSFLRTILLSRMPSYFGSFFSCSGLALCDTTHECSGSLSWNPSACALSLFSQESIREFDTAGVDVSNALKDAQSLERLARELAVLATAGHASFRRLMASRLTVLLRSAQARDPAPFY